MSIEEIAGLHREVRASEGEILLETTDLTVRFGGLVALDAVSLNIRRGEILGLIGPNGAGKTTCFNAITGVYRPSAGTVMFDGAPLGRIKRHQITRRGIARTFQIVQPFPEMTALENVMAGALFAGGSADMQVAAARARRPDNRPFAVSLSATAATPPPPAKIPSAPRARTGSHSSR